MPPWADGERGPTQTDTNGTVSHVRRSRPDAESEGRRLASEALRGAGWAALRRRRPGAAAARARARARRRAAWAVQAGERGRRRPRGAKPLASKKASM